MSKTITKVKFKKAGEKGVSITTMKYDDGGKRRESVVTDKYPPHDDFKASMQKLTPHFLLIAEMIPVGKLKKAMEVPEKELEGYRVSGVTISGEGAKETITITGYRTLSTGRGYVINTSALVENEQETKYKFMGELLADIEGVRESAQEYLGGKCGTLTNQGELELKTEPVIED